MGHLQLLNYAKSLGGELHIGINSDSSIKKIKGKDRPILNQKMRKKFIEELNIAKKVYVFNEITPLKIIKKIKPTIIVKGNDYKKSEVVGYKDILKWNGIVKIFKKKNKLSSSDILRKSKNAK